MGSSVSLLSFNTRNFLRLTLKSNEMKKTGKTMFNASRLGNSDAQIRQMKLYIENKGFNVTVSYPEDRIAQFDISKGY